MNQIALLLAEKLQESEGNARYLQGIVSIHIEMMDGNA